MSRHSLREVTAGAPEAPSTSGDAADPFEASSPSRPVRPFAPGDSLLQLVFHNLDRQLVALEREIDRASDNGVTVEGVHAMRTGSRRIRATLRSFREMLPRAARQRLGDEMAWLARTLGSVRDLDVQRAMLERDTAAASDAHDAEGVARYARRLHAAHGAAARELLAELRGPRVRALLREFHAFLDRAPSRAAVRRWSDLGAREGAEDFALHSLRRIRRFGRKIDHDGATADSMHDLRIRCKRFRYLLESLEPACGGELQQAIQLTRRLQDTLGHRQDARVAIERLEDEIKLTREEVDAATVGPLESMLAIREREARAAEAEFADCWGEFAARVRGRTLRKRIRAAAR
jgi:CHAD domain-containing protein